ncbi:MAG: zf-HC2 domain-containing protein [Gemmatimonadetes bacterium]|nr:zf-HC2 domain-containing protein [Gemmatimonadota bacterium]
MSETDRVTCEEFVRELPALLDREVGAADHDRLQAHLDACARCLRKHRFESAILAGLKARLRSVPTPSGLEDRIMAVVALADRGGPHAN